MESIFALSKNIPETLTRDQALPLLIKAAELGQSRGCFSLLEAKVLHEAIKNVQSSDANEEDARIAKSNLVIAAEKTQKAGNTFSFSDAALLVKAVETIKDELRPPSPPAPQQESEPSE